MRRTGKTFRALLKAIVKASEGYSVFYVCKDHEVAKQLHDQAARVTNYHHSGVTHHSIHFENGGKIVFISETLMKNKPLKCGDKIMGEFEQ
jgi:hypothetical protein